MWLRSSEFEGKYTIIIGVLISFNGSCAANLNSGPRRVFFNSLLEIMTLDTEMT